MYSKGNMKKKHSTSKKKCSKTGKSCKKQCKGFCKMKY